MAVKYEPKTAEAIAALDQIFTILQPSARDRQKRKPTGKAKVAVTIRLSPAAYSALMAAGGRQIAEAMIEIKFGL